MSRGLLARPSVEHHDHAQHEQERTMSDRPKGPASYFPSIEAKYGRSIDEWLAAMRETGLTKHSELVAWLKEEHGFGHGHASAITHHFRSTLA
jgi:hypothetical protein